MSLSQWGEWDEDMDPVLLTSLGESYVRRIKWESRALAAAVWNALEGNGEGGGRAAARRRAQMGNDGRVYRRLDPDTQMRVAGVEWQ